MTTRADVDLVIVNPSGRSRIYQSLGASLAAIEPPVWAGLIATYVRRQGFSVAVIDAGAEDLDAAETVARVTAFRPRLVAVVVYGHQPSASTQVMPEASAVCRLLKDAAPHLPTILVGGHVAALPERTLREESADFVCGGEGPVTVLELLGALTSRGTPRDVRGLWYRDGDRICATPAAPLVSDLDRDMPGIAWDLLPMTRYRAHNWHCFGHLDARKPYAALYTTLGCPYHCSFCCIQAPFKSGEQLLGMKASVNSYRFWSPATVAAQIDVLVERHGVRTIKIADEMFVLNERHVHGLCDLLIERNHGLKMWAYARVDSVRKDETLDKLKAAGVNWLCFGIEAASERVRRDVRKSYDEDDVERVLERVRRAGIYVMGNFIFGLPEDDLDTMQQTLDLALELNCEFANFYSAMAYPGSELYRLAVREGWPLPATWNGYSQHAADTLPLPTRYLSGADVLRFRDYAFQVYFTNSRYLELVERTFGSETVAHIREMTSHRLERNYA